MNDARQTAASFLALSHDVGIFSGMRKTSDEDGSANRTMLSRGLQRQPETATELRAVAQNVGAPASSIYLRQAASETTVKRAALADYRVVYCATHGLVAGEIKGLAEPSLALTLPKNPNDIDDGLLTASEVAQLKLNADWVVLSACNAGDKPGAEALSGLARAFFYAGARALLVSHWAVDRRCGSPSRRSSAQSMRHLEDLRIGEDYLAQGSVIAHIAGACPARFMATVYPKSPR